MAVDLKIVLQVSNPVELMSCLQLLENYDVVHRKSFAPEVKSKR